jgi:hypothetical protein
MKRTYALSQQFILSRDLRISLALSRPGTPQQLLFDNLLSANNLMSVGGDSKQLLYNDLALMKQKAFLDRVHESEGLVFNRKSRRIDLQGTYHRGTCVVVGSGAGVELEAVKQAQDAGCAVVTLGNACFLYEHADIWVGNSPVTAYYARGLESPRTTAFVPLSRMHDNLWDHTKKEFVQTQVSDMPNVIYYRGEPDKGIKDYLQKPRVMDLGIDSSFTIAMTLLPALGFTDILLTGIDLGGTLDSFFGFTEIPHQDAYREKRMKFERISQLSEELIQEYTDHAIRLYGIGSVALDVPCFPPDMIPSLFLGLMPRTSQTTDLRGITVPHATKTKVRDLLNTHKNASLTVAHVGDKLKEIIEAAPHTFGDKEFKGILVELQEALKGASCAPCTRNKITRPAFTRFIKEIAADNKEALDCWETVFPDQYVVVADGTLKFRPDKKHLDAELKELQL